MGQRGRKRRRATRPATRPARGPGRDTAIRDALAPLGPGERPTAVTVAAVVSVALCGVVIVGYATHAKLGSQKPTISSAIALVALLVIAAAGMWRAKYWAVLGFEMLLAFQIIIAALALVVANNVLAVILCLAVIGPGGWLFYKLIRAMARLQMPERPARR